jgi:hypothetical protein
MTPRTFPGPCL